MVLKYFSGATHRCTVVTVRGWTFIRTRSGLAAKRPTNTECYDGSQYSGQAERKKHTECHDCKNSLDVFSATSRYRKCGRNTHDGRSDYHVAADCTGAE